MSLHDKRMSQGDPTSYSEPEKCEIQRLNWNVRLDFNNKIIKGIASLSFKKKTDDLNQVLLDIRELNIENVKLQGSDLDLKFKIDNPVNVDYGSRLSIELPTIQSESFTLDITYSTSKSSSALQWMTPEQTAGKRQPYLYSQCQAIHARSLYPCQDTPAVRFTYKAQVEAPQQITVLMSSNRGEVVAKQDTSITHFTMAIPIPSYLLAIVAGDLESRDIGPRSKVWSEREMVEAAAYEFAETESMLQAAEDLMGPYVWGQYDLLVLPPSFPYGGMENPCLTFVTPTLLAGDRSLVNVVAHEISHSWTGNLVTNANFEHFWLNEGHTVFFERKIHSKLYGEAKRQLHAHEGWLALEKTVEELTVAGRAPYTKLVPDLCGVDPDETFSCVPYEKGFSLLEHLEKILGGPGVFNKFLRAYIEHFKYKSIRTQDWKEFLFKYFSSVEDQEKLENINWDQWLYGEGLPPFTPNYDLILAQPSRNLSQRWISAPESEMFSDADIKALSSDLINNFLSKVQKAKPAPTLSKVQKMEAVYHFNGVKNSEIRFTWLQLCIQSQWNDAIVHVINFINEQGRMKFVVPLYRSMIKWEEGREPAWENFLAHKAEMHSTTVKKVEELFTDASKMENST